MRVYGPVTYPTFTLPLTFTLPHASDIEVTDMYRHDRTGWKAGPWDEEPDRVLWRDVPTGLLCKGLRNHDSLLTGYVGIERDHPLFEQRQVELWAEGSNPAFPYVNFAGWHDLNPNRFLAPTVWWFGFSCPPERNCYPRLSTTDEIMAAFTAEPSEDTSDYYSLRDVAEHCHLVAGKLAAATAM